jgi:hypothetical protein
MALAKHNAMKANTGIGGKTSLIRNLSTDVGEWSASCCDSKETRWIQSRSGRDVPDLATSHRLKKHGQNLYSGYKAGPDETFTPDIIPVNSA